MKRERIKISIINSTKSTNQRPKEISNWDVHLVFWGNEILEDLTKRIVGRDFAWIYI